MKKRLIALTAVSVLAVASCGGPAEEEAQDATNDTNDVDSSLTVVLANTSCVLNAPIYSGLTEGFYEEEGLDLSVEAVNGSAAVLQAMLSGQADFGNPGAIPVIAAQGRNEDVAYFANSSPGGSFFLITPEDSGVESPEDLQDMTIGVATADGNEVGFVDVIMNGAGLSEDEYEKLTVGEGGQAVAAFERGDVDAYAASADGFATIEEAGISPVDITPRSEVDYMIGNGYAAPRELFDTEADGLSAFGAAYNRAVDWAIENPEDAIDNCNEYSPQEVEDQEYALRLLEISSETWQSPHEDEPWGSMREEDWEAMIQDAVEAGHVDDGEVDVESVYTNELVDGFQR